MVVSVVKQIKHIQKKKKTNYLLVYNITKVWLPFVEYFVDIYSFDKTPCKRFQFHTFKYSWIPKELGRYICMYIPYC